MICFQKPLEVCQHVGVSRQSHCPRSFRVFKVVCQGGINAHFLMAVFFPSLSFFFLDILNQWLGLASLRYARGEQVLCVTQKHNGKLLIAKTNCRLQRRGSSQGLKPMVMESKKCQPGQLHQLFSFSHMILLSLSHSLSLSYYHHYGKPSGPFSHAAKQTHFSSFQKQQNNTGKKKKKNSKQVVSEAQHS